MQKMDIAIGVYTWVPISRVDLSKFCNPRFFQHIPRHAHEMNTSFADIKQLIKEIIYSLIQTL